MNCSKCGALLVDGNSFCTNCGTKISFLNNSPVPIQRPINVPQAPIQQVGINMSSPQVRNNQICSKCNSPILPGNTFCTNCGASITSMVQQSMAPQTNPSVLTCTKCKKPVVPGNDFCLNCGARITMLPESSSQVVQRVVVPVPVAQQRVVTLNSVNVVKDNSAEDNSKANKLCGLCLLLYFSPVLVYLFAVIVLFINQDYSEIISAFSGLTSLARLAAIVLMIVTRIKYPNNKFAKVLMWLWIGSIILTVVLALLFVFILLLGFLAS